MVEQRAMEVIAVGNVVGRRVLGGVGGFEQVYCSDLESEILTSQLLHNYVSRSSVRSPFQQRTAHSSFVALL
jgi:hypothetical protein